MLKEWKSRTIAAGGNAKTVKGDDIFQTAIMYLAPYTAAGGQNLCPMAETAGCIQACLFTKGRAAFTPSINPARVRKTQRYLADRAAFMAELVRDIGNFVKHCNRIAVRPAIRLNGTSDIQWEIAHPCVRDGVRYASIFEAFPEAVFYDYTKLSKRVRRDLPANYSLTLSYSGANAAYGEMIWKAARESGANVAVVFRTKAIRDAAMGANDYGFPVINGDETDMRFTDPKGCIVGLYAKGSARHDRTGFVVG